METKINIDKLICSLYDAMFDGSIEKTRFEQALRAQGLEVKNSELVEISKNNKPTLSSKFFHDANFRKALVSKLRISEGDEITEAKIAATTSLDVSRYGKPDSEKIADLAGIEHFTALTSLYCSYNQLTSLDVSKNTALKLLVCYNNQIKSEAMDALVASLPTVSKGDFYVIDTKDKSEGNVCTKSQIAIAKGKGWTVYAWSGYWQEYYGSENKEIEERATNITPICLPMNQTEAGTHLKEPSARKALINLFDETTAFLKEMSNKIEKYKENYEL